MSSNPLITSDSQASKEAIKGWLCELTHFDSVQVEQLMEQMEQESEDLDSPIETAQVS